MILARLFIAAFMCLLPAAVQAGASDWYETTGTRLRLLTQMEPAPDETLRGALEIDLEPGWKTYWKEPGEGGVAPQLALSDARAATSIALDFPAPQRFDDGGLQWAGYDARVVLPVVVTGLADARAPLAIDLFIGVCETICVPVQTRLAVRPADDTGPIEHFVIDEAFAKLPDEPRDGFQATGVSVDGEALAIAVELPDGGQPADIFLAGRDGLMLSAPEFAPGPGGGIFTARILSHGTSERPQATYTLVAGKEAVSGALPLP